MLFLLPHLLCVGWAGPDGAGGRAASRLWRKDSLSKPHLHAPVAPKHFATVWMNFQYSPFFGGGGFLCEQKPVLLMTGTQSCTWADVEMINSVYQPAS